MTDNIAENPICLKIKAPAKVNWHLQVGKIRSDGFHPINSIFQIISVFDELFIECSKSDIPSIKVTGLEDYVPLGHSTLDKAFALWTESTGKTLSVSVDVKKCIPVQSGLGGGSSDAASLIIALEHITGNTLSHDSLIDVAARTGSDVPFFVYSCSAALVFGRGEFVHPIQHRSDISGWVVIPKCSKKSTSLAYKQLDMRHKIPDFIDPDSLVSVYNSNIERWNFTNDFELVNDKFNFPIRSFLTGSGSCRILLYSDVSLYLKSNDWTYCDSFVSDSIGNLYSKIGFTTSDCSYSWA